MALCYLLSTSPTLLCSLGTSVMSEASAHFCQPYIFLLCLLCHLNRFKMVTCDFNFLSDKVFYVSAVFWVSSC